MPARDTTLIILPDPVFLNSGSVSLTSLSGPLKLTSNISSNSSSLSPSRSPPSSTPAFITKPSILLKCEIVLDTQFFDSFFSFASHMHFKILSPSTLISLGFLAAKLKTQPFSLRSFAVA